MKLDVTLISDTHAKHNMLTNYKSIRNSKRPLDLPGGDLLIHAGDFMNGGYHKQEETEFFDWFS